MPPMKEFKVAAVKPLPVLLLADVSGSMAGDKMVALNQAIRDLLAALQREPERHARLQLAVILFDDLARVHVPLQPVSQVTWTDAAAGGTTAMGSALALTADLVEDAAVVPSDAWRPVVVLLSDGAPTDRWEDALKRFTDDGRRAHKADRVAVAIGSDADETVLARFVGPGRPVHRAEDAGRIPEFFQWLTMSVTNRSRSETPNMPLFDEPHQSRHY